MLDIGMEIMLWDERINSEKVFISLLCCHHLLSQGAHQRFMNDLCEEIYLSMFHTYNMETEKSIIVILI